MLNASSGFACWLKPSYAGPCGYEGHCESAISSQALWDLSARDLVNVAKPYGLDQNSAWILADKLWYRSRSTATAAYACPSLATTNGCGAGNLFTVFRVIDDDDGDLSNGTPHASAIYDAFNRHAIACTTVNNTDHTGCTAITAPTLGGSSGSNSNSLSWNTVAGAATYDLYRNESGCDAGYTKIYSGATASYVDNQAIDGMVYYYRVQAIGTNIVCTSLMSNCVALSPSTPSGVLTGTVRDSVTSNPLANVAVQAVSGSYNYVATTDASGVYTMPLVAVGTYDVTATVFGYLPGSVTGVSVTLGNTTTQDFVLSAAPNFAVSGAITDANTGWGLYASIHITAPGWAGMTTFTDLATGAYSVSLTAGSTYTFTVTSRVPGYNTGTASVGPVMEPITQNFGLVPDACGAPGYASAPIVSWDFNAGQPAGWTVVNDGGTCDWVFDDPGGRTNLTGGTGTFAMADADHCGSGSTMNTELRTPAQDFSAYPSVTLSFKSDYRNLNSDESADVDVSANGASGPWTTVWHQNTNQRGPMTVTLDISAIAGGQSNVMVRWHYIAPGWDWWWEVDDVAFLACQAPAGGLIVGFVSDATTANAIVGASVVNATTAFTGISDTEGFYAVYAAAGANALTASKSTYGDGTATPTGVAHATVRQDFNLATAGQVMVTGTVTDATTGWPLYATLAFSSSGVPTQTVYTNPLTGAYSVTIFSGMVYNVGGTAYVAGYTPLATTIGPLASNVTQDYTLAADTMACSAPGYASTTVPQNFDAVTPPALPANWAMVRTGGTDTATAWATRVGTRYPSDYPAGSVPNLVFFNSFSVSSGNSALLYSTTPVDLTVTGASITFQMFHDTGYTTNDDRVQVQVSTDGGTTWQNVGSPISRYLAASNAWSWHTVPLTGFSGPSTSVMVGINAISAYGNDIHLDNILIGTASCAPPAGGGLILGYTYNAETGDPVAAVTVTNSTAGTSAITAATPDPAVGDSFYCLYGAEGANAMTATKASYGIDAQTATVPHYGAVQQDFHLATGHLATAPTSLEITLPSNSTGTQALTLQNVGGADAAWTVRELPGHVALTGANIRASEKALVPDVPQRQRIILSIEAPKSKDGKAEKGEPASPAFTKAGSGASGTHAMDTWPPSGPIQLVVDDGVAEDSVGLNSSSAGFQFLWLNRFTPDAGSFPFLLDQVSVILGSGAAPVGGALDLVVYQDTDGDGDPSNATWLATYHVNVQVSDNATWNNYTLSTPVLCAGPGDVLVGVVNRYTQSGVDAPAYPAGLDETASVGRSWVAGYNADPADPPVLPADNIWGTIDSQGLPGNWTLRASGYPADIPWIDEDIKSGTVPASGSQAITVSYDTTGLAEGDYLATLSFSNDTPYGNLNVPVTLHVVNCPTSIAFAPASLPMGNTHSAYNQTITATSTPAGDTFTFSVTAGALPPGLALSSAGAITGTPTLVGNYTFTVTATDPVGCSGSHQYTLAVSGYDLSFKDDNGRSQACVDSKT